MASVAAASSSCSCSTVFTSSSSSSSTPFRSRTPRPSLRPLPHRARLPLPGHSVVRCLQKCESRKPPPLGGTTGLSGRKGAEPAGRGEFRAAPLDASCGLAFATVAGMIMLQGSQQALAATRFAGLQPADVLGDLGDITSGDDEKINEEQEEAELAVSKFSGNGTGVMSAASTVASTFVLVFVAEWGDKSFFSTIALAAASSPLGVIAGSLAGHALATVIAVLGGSLLGTFLSEKIIAYIGGSLFLAFAAITIVEIVT